MEIDTRVQKVDGADPVALDLAAATLRSGGLVAFPTETVYGLGANALDPDAVARIFMAKGRPATNPVIVHVASLTQAASLTINWSDTAARLAARFWPGPLTLVLPKRDLVPDIVTAHGPTVALRMPAHPVARALIERCGLPLAAPSANRSTRISPTTAAHVLKDLAGRVELILDAGPTSGGLESTVLDLTSHPPRVLRPGLITAAQLAQELGAPVSEFLSESQTESATDIARSPGQMLKHYSPSVPVEICAAQIGERLSQLAASAARVGWIALPSDVPRPPAQIEAHLIVITLSAEPAEYAAGFYAALHALEDAGVERIVVSQPPSGGEWIAIHDRLRRAASS